MNVQEFKTEYGVDRKCPLCGSQIVFSHSTNDGSIENRCELYVCENELCVAELLVTFRLSKVEMGNRETGENIVTWKDINVE